MKIAINGFGRIGRLALRTYFLSAQNKNLEVVAINNPGEISQLTQLFEFDSTYGRFPGKLSFGEDFIEINGNKIKIFGDRDPENLPWGDLGVDLVLECTGVFTTSEGLKKHLKAGAKRVLLSAPAKDEVDQTFVYGVNHETFDPKNHLVISNASCTTNCLAPVAKVLDEEFGIERALMTTIHSYTGDQRILDSSHKDMRRARGAAQNIVPTKTGAAKAVALVIPELKGKFDGLSVRVPTPTVSIVDLNFEAKKEISVEKINSALKKASKTNLRGILGFEERELVSGDFRANTHSSIVDAGLTRVIGNFGKVFAWYDNEYGYATRLIEMANFIGSKS